MCEPPRERLYLFRYFRTHLEKAFLRYYYCFGDYEHFTDHTGFYCQRRWLRLLMKRHERIVAVHDKLKEEIACGCEDEKKLTLLAQIESGKYKLRG